MGFEIIVKIRVKRNRYYKKKKKKKKKLEMRAVVVLCG